MFRTACLAAASCLSLALAAPALAQSHDHAGHGTAGQGQAGHGHTGHGHAHADFQSGRFHVRVDGAEGGRDVILIPGLTSHPAIWQDLVDHLGPDVRVHRLHVAGFAGAPAEDNAQGPVAAPVAEDLARYIREQGLEKPVVIGHSMGGTIALMLAARHPDAVGRLVVVDMVPFMGAMFGAPGVTAEQVTPIADQIHAAMASSPRAAYDAQAAATIAGMINTESRRAEAVRHMETSDQAVAAAAYRELIVTDLRPELPAVTAPTTVLYVKFNDARMTNEITDAIYQASFATLAGATLKRIDDSAHFIMFDQADRFHAEVDAVLAQ